MKPTVDVDLYADSVVETHATRRQVQMRSLGAKALAPTAERLDEEAGPSSIGLYVHMLRLNRTRL